VGSRLVRVHATMSGDHDLRHRLIHPGQWSCLRGTGQSRQDLFEGGDPQRLHCSSSALPMLQFRDLDWQRQRCCVHVFFLCFYIFYIKDNTD
jgi:hypothetical protein